MSLWVSTRSPAAPSSASFWFHGSLEDAEERRRELAAQFAEYRSIRRAAPFLTVGELLERWVAAQHEWRPSTWVGVRSNVKALSADPSPNGGWPPCARRWCG